MSSSWIWSDKITNERVARVGYNHFISNKGEWNNCFSKISKWVLPPIFISTILQSGKFLYLVYYFPYDAKLRLLAHSRSFLANQKARNAIVRAKNLLIIKYCHYIYLTVLFYCSKHMKCSAVEIKSCLLVQIYTYAFSSQQCSPDLIPAQWHMWVDLFVARFLPCSEDFYRVLYFCFPYTKYRTPNSNSN